MTLPTLQKPYITINDAAQRLDVVRLTITRAIKAGKLPATKVAGRVLIDLDDLTEYSLRYRGGKGITRA